MVIDYFFMLADLIVPQAATPQIVCEKLNWVTDNIPAEIYKLIKNEALDIITEFSHDTKETSLQDL